MPTLTAQTTFTIDEPADVYENSVDLTLLAANEGTDALRELHYPGDIYPAIIYDQNPEWWDNFDTEPLTSRPGFKAELTIADVAMATWPGYVKDFPIREYWRGDESKSYMTLDMLRRMWEYFANPPDTGYIEWWPKDRTETGYYIQIESLTVGGSEGISMNLYATRGDIVLKEVVLTFRIVSEIP